MSVVVIGAGPAGMAAALAAADAGAEVTLVDSAPAVGGQYHRGAARIPGADKLLRHRLIHHHHESVVWAIEPADVHNGHRVHVRTGPADGPGRHGRTFTAGALVLATGAYDRTLPFPGWDLPGVVTAGAAQAMAKGHGVAVGSRVVVAGTGPFLLPVAESLVLAGARVAEVLEANGAVAGWLRTPKAVLAGAGRTRELARYLKVLATHRIPYRPHRTVIAAHGSTRVDEVTTAALDRQWRIVPGSERTVQADAVCVGFGFTPQLELAAAARCRITGGFVEVDHTQATSVPGVFAAGELTGIGGARLAADEGTVAGTAAAAHLGRGTPPPLAALRRVRAGRIFAVGLARAYPVRDGWRTWPREDTLVCRCEEVTLAGLRAAADTAHGVRALKLISRAGLGACQGRVCGVNIAELAGEGFDPLDTARRPIAAPLRLGELAEEEEDSP